MSTAVSIDPSNEVNVSGVFSGHSFRWVVEQFEEDDETPRPFEGVCSMKIFYDPEKKKLAMTLTENDGILRGDGVTAIDIDGTGEEDAIVYGTNTIIISQSKIVNTLKAWTYFFTLYTGLDTDNSYVILRGTITSNPA